MVESFAFFVLALAIFLGVCKLGMLHAERRDKQRDHTEARINDRMYQIDCKLWELLHKEDPTWLALMGIETPQYTLRQEIAVKEAVRENQRKARDKEERRVRDEYRKMTAGEIIMVNRPTDVIVMPMYPAIDRSVEEKLEARLKEHAEGVSQIQPSQWKQA